MISYSLFGYWGDHIGIAILFYNTAQEAPAGVSTSSSSSDYLFLPPLGGGANLKKKFLMR